MSESETNTALVLGATGGVGGELTRLLVERGWHVRALNRAPKDSGRGITWLKGDAMNATDVREAAKGVSVVVHAVNPPGYRNWGRLVMPMIDNTIAAARAEGALIVLPGTVYNYGPDAFPDLKESSPQNPRTRKGRIRVEMEKRLENASREGATVLIVRAGDFFGPRAANNWFSQGLVRPGHRVSVVTYPGSTGIGHQWAYLPDVASTMLALIERRAHLPEFARFHMDGQWDPDGRAMIDAIRRMSGNPKIKVRRLPWSLSRLVAPFNETLREMLEMRYLWRIPVRLDNTKLVSLLGAEPRTPLDVAVKTTLEGLGCL